MDAREYSHLLAAKLKNYAAFTIQDKSLLKILNRQLTSELALSLVSLNWCYKNDFYISRDDLDRSMNQLYSNYFSLDLLTSQLNYNDVSKGFWINSTKRELCHQKILTKIAKEVTDGAPAAKKNNKTFKKVGIRILRSNNEILLQELRRLKEDNASSDRLDYVFSPLLYNIGNKPTYVTRDSPHPFDRAINLKLDRNSRIYEINSNPLFYTITSREDAAMPIAISAEDIDKAYRVWLVNELKKTPVFIDRDLINKLSIKLRI